MLPFASKPSAFRSPNKGEPENSEIVPSAEMRPTLSRPASTNHIAPFGPSRMSVGPAAFSSEYQVGTPVGVTRPIPPAAVYQASPFGATAMLGSPNSAFRPGIGPLPSSV